LHFDRSRKDWKIEERPTERFSYTEKKSRPKHLGGTNAPKTDLDGAVSTREAKTILKNTRCSRRKQLKKELDVRLHLEKGPRTNWA